MQIGQGRAEDSSHHRTVFRRLQDKLGQNFNPDCSKRIVAVAFRVGKFPWFNIPRDQKSNFASRTKRERPDELE